MEEEGEIYGFLNLGDGTGIGCNSKFYDVWTMANGGPPRKQQVMSLRVFIGKIFRVQIGDVEHLHDGKNGSDPRKWKKHSEATKYSTIREWIACEGP